MTNRTPRIYDIERVVHGNKVKTDFIQAPFTEIVNEQGQPRRIPDLANNLKASLGPERIDFDSFKKLDKEFGPVGQAVYELGNKDPRVRFVGGDWFFASNSSGSYPAVTGTVADAFVEITFFGTGLNIVLAYEDGARDWRASVDGGAEGGNIFPNGSTVINNRGYAPNHIVPLFKGLSLGLHTVKVRKADTSFQFGFGGFEILNESQQVVVNPGIPFVGGPEAELTAQQLLDIKPSDLTGTKGGRVLTYIDQDGNVGQAVTEVDATAQYLTSTNHSNEEIVRTINFREFGKNRSDDFSALDGSTNKILFFTLDDGTTTLTANNVRVNSVEDIQLRGAGSFVVITFVGTGLDLFSGSTGTPAVVPDIDVIVDGVTVGQYIRGGTNKICSGLPYGTHTVKIEQTGSGNSGVFQDMIIYGPKRPELPNDATEIADYNVMADYASSTDSNNLNEHGTGVLFKSAFREFVYEGASWDTGFFNADFKNLFPIRASAVTGRKIKYTFFGTGINILGSSNSNGVDVQVKLDGSLYTGAATILGGSGSWTPGTSTWDVGTPFKPELQIHGLSLGLHTIELEITTNTDQFYFNGVEIVTPIHINSPGFKLGSLAMLDLRADNQIEGEARSKTDWTRAKALLSFDQAGTLVNDSHNVSSVVTVQTGRHIMYTKVAFKSWYAIATANSTGNANPHAVDVRQLAPNAFEFVVQNNDSTTSGVYEDNPVSIVLFGELEGEEDISLDDL